MHQYILYLVRLFYFDANTHTVDRRLDEDFLVLIARDEQRVEEDFWGAGSFDFGDVVSFGRLRGKVGEREGGC